MSPMTTNRQPTPDIAGRALGEWGVLAPTSADNPTSLQQQSPQIPSASLSTPQTIPVNPQSSGPFGPTPTPLSAQIQQQLRNYNNKPGDYGANMPAQIGPLANQTFGANPPSVPVNSQGPSLTTPPSLATPTGPVNNAPPKSTTPASTFTDPLSFQAAMSYAIAPLLHGFAAANSPGQINAALENPQSAANSPLSTNLASQLSSNIQSQVADYQSGLNALAQSSGAAPFKGQPDSATLQAILKGMTEILAFPTSYSGQQGAPPSAANSPLMTLLYSTLNAYRNPASVSAGPQIGPSAAVNPTAPVSTLPTSNAAQYSTINNMLFPQNG